MASEQAKELRQQGIAAAKAGQKEQARELLRQSLRLEPGNEAAWTWLVTVAKDTRERIICLYKLLEINPNSEIGLKAMQAMGMTLEQLRAQVMAHQTPLPSTRTPQATPVPSGRPAPPAAPAGQNVPVPDAVRLANAQSAAEEIVQRFLNLPAAEGIQWTQKKRRRAGEGDAVVFRAQVILAAVVVIGLLLGLGFLLLISTPQGQALVFAPTSTASVTPSITPSPTFGATPTPSPTPRLTVTPSATPPAQLTPANLFSLPPTPTDIYPQILVGRAVEESAVLIARGLPLQALPTLEAQRAIYTGPSFDPAPFYYSALALTDADRPDDALDVLDDANSQIADLAPSEQQRDRVLIDSGYAYVYLYQAQQAARSRRPAEADDFLALVIERAEAARAADPRFVQPYLLLARAYALQEDYDQALLVLSDGLAVPQLASDANLLLAIGQVYFQQGEYDLAAYQAFLALYVDPTLTAAHRLRILSALASGDPGLAVLYTQQYLFYYPGSVEAYTLLGDARVAEGNDDLALLAYSQALQGARSDPAYVRGLVARAALYSSQRRYDRAREDLTDALNLSDDDPAIRALRMVAAYLAGRYETAAADAETLLGEDVLPDEEIRLLQARILVDTAQGDTEQLNNALSLLQQAGDVPAQPGVAAEYRARVQFELGLYSDALDSINDALRAGESGSRYLLLAQILEQQTEFESAARAYEWVLSWGNIYPYPFLAAAQEGLERVRTASQESETP